MDYFLHIGILILIYAVLSISLNIISGYTGMISLAHAAFYGVGAYTTAILATRFHSPFLLNIICAIIISGFFGALIGLPSVRIHDDFFVIATFAFQVVVLSLISNFSSLTGGVIGISNIPNPKIFFWHIDNNFDFFLLTGIVSIILTLAAIVIVTSPYGRIIKAIREDEVFVLTAGKNVAKVKVTVFVIGAAMASVSGVLYAHYITFIDPSSFSVMESILIISMVILGGAGSIQGSIFGAFVLVILPEALRFLGLPGSTASNLRQVFYGGLLIFFMIWRPQGLLGEFAFKRGQSEK